MSLKDLMIRVIRIIERIISRLYMSRVSWLLDGQIIPVRVQSVAETSGPSWVKSWSG